MTYDWQRSLVSCSTSIRDTIQTIDTSALQIALVTDEQNLLLGTVTDGDIRRAILNNIQLDAPVYHIMHQSPVTITEDINRQSVLQLMRQTGKSRIPVINDKKQVVDLVVLESLVQPEKKENTVVLMAGGLGTRLRPLTENCPKPLLKVGEKPVLQTIIENFRDQGFSNFYLSVNYKADMIKNFFKDGSHLNVSIGYLHEYERLGTAGALTLLPHTPNTPLIVMNGDLLTKVDYQRLLNFHTEHHAQATMCVREYDFQVPYGVVKIDGQRIVDIQEKPINRFFVNAGVYVLQPEVLSLIPQKEFFDMPTLFQQLIAQQQECSVFPIREYWIDIGQMADLERANNEFNQNF